MRLLLVLIAAIGITFSVSAQNREVTVAAAANLSEVFQQIAPQFELATGIHPVFSYGSTAQLTTQIENGAPFDVFAAADVEHIKHLVQKGLMLPGSWSVYATGILALWSPPRSKVQINQLQDLTQPIVKVIAMAKPELAPYGLAARETLQKQGIWKLVESKVVYADNINMAKQYGSSGNADAVFTAYSLVLKEPGKVIQIEDKMHSPIDQAIGVVSASKNQRAGLDFISFLIAGKGRDILRNSGYRVR